MIQNSTGTARNNAFRLPPALIKQGEALLEQQMWCWGCDVRRKSGNLLLEYGFEQRTSPQPRYHSAYTCQLQPGCTLTLWGWGVWVADEGRGSLLLSRSRFRVGYTSQADLYPQAWCADDLAATRLPSTQVEQRSTLYLLETTCRWITGYERWLATQVDPTYREQACTAWPQRRRYRGGVPAAEIACRWQVLSEALSKEAVQL